MIKAITPEGKTVWLSEDNDWTNKDGHTISVWHGCDISESEYPDFIDFVKTEIGADVEPVGSFNTVDKMIIFVFLVKSEIEKFAIWRFNVGGIRWWYDAFWETNGGQEVADTELLPIIEKLGLTVNSEVGYVYSD